MFRSLSTQLKGLFLRMIEYAPEKYRQELSYELMIMNINRERILSFVLAAISLVMLYSDLMDMRSSSTDAFLLRVYFILHTVLLVVPIFFLIAVHPDRAASPRKKLIQKSLHILINFLILAFCAMIAVNNKIIDQHPFGYVVAMFCIASMVLLVPGERYFLFLSSYAIYFGGLVAVGKSMVDIAGDLFYSFLLLSLALTVSNTHLKSFVKGFIDNKTIAQNNLELDRLNKIIEEALEKRTRELKETVEYEKLRSAFLANISHELRTPLTVIFSAQQMLGIVVAGMQPQEKSKEILQYMSMIKRNCYRLMRLIANLIDITKIDAGYFQLHLQNCDIIRIVEDITLSVAKYVEDRELQLTFDTEVEERILACDPDKIERIMLNLLSNAVKYTHCGGSIYVNIRVTDDVVEIYVIDTGTGIPEEMRESVFERFVQVDKTTARTREGSGIGLAIVKSLVEMHDGNIMLTSELGKGSEFKIRLPIKTVPEPVKAAEYKPAADQYRIDKIHVEFSDIYSHEK
jgi:two-component system, OmpR family, phosphate regulon sensor histidine kinase PhoR